ncbi:hypothetical protein LMJF_33_2190 [Leishmania major strain Friedlin]|uniref:Uncharacterized protein n=1 Tax=Leishmania major TaxID=5664 RepID=Q4Q3W8_LEIMA|nr:hypothetical protein LMJF_33_2190 [Leishmania major strain Friedlin]CAG9580820.1 hypothetical_protein_-_conserved [Leishmania major strain Friedlin]CAJ06583.1 hypothetical protein LMJF_33_2190 [Leishmania major strain Friedlin]|eukprot:XP_001685980.1 hypothetical protein LMJF_33_2190 [Leishmania major strain Friedlin]
MRTRRCSRSQSSQHVDSENNFYTATREDAAPASTALKRGDPAFAVPSTKTHVNAALLVEPFHCISAAARQGTSLLRHASVTSSRVRQRKSPCDVPPSTRNASVLTPGLPRGGLPQEESAHRLIEALPLTPDDVLGCVSTGSSPHAAHAPVHGGVAGAVAERVHGAEIAHGEGQPTASVVSSPSQYLSQTSPLALAGAVPSPSSRQTSPSAVRARLTDASTQGDGRFDRLLSCFCAEEAQQQRLFLVAQRCHLIQQEEAAAREWRALDASVQQHRIVREERAAYRLVKSQQDHRRLPDASAYSVVGADAFGNDLTRARSAERSPSPFPEEALHLAATPPSGQRRRRMLSASLRSLLCPGASVPASAPDGDDGENRLGGFSLSTSLPRLVDHRNEDSVPHDQDAPASFEEVHQHTAEKSNSEEKDEALGDAAEEAQGEPRSSMRSSEVNQWTTSPPRALPPLPSSEGLGGELLARIRDLHNEEEDQRFLLTGDCPPPDVFQRWTARYCEDKRVCFSSAASGAGQPSALRAALSPEAAERCCSRSDSPAIAPPTHDGAAFIALAPSDSALARVPAAALHDRSRSPLLSATAEQADEEFLRREGASASWHRLCSEHRRAWAMENFFGTDVAYANYHDGWSAGSARSPLPSSREESEFNASGRCAPDPRIFGAGPSAAPPSAFSPPSHAAPSSSVPQTTRIESAAPRAKIDFSQQPPKSVTADSSLLRKMACPTEKTYLAPMGSEREAWQALMDAFIDGLLQIMALE